MISQNQPRRLKKDCCRSPFLTASVELGFTLMEVLLVIALIVLILTALLILFNPKKQIERGWDGKRKKEIDTLAKVFEDYYNDKNCYPKPSEVCVPDTEDTLSTGNIICKICGSDPNSPNFEPYLSSLPCDPQYPSKYYLYEVDNNSCPSFFRIYAKLSNKRDVDIEKAGCSSGCAPEGYVDISNFDEEKVFNYGKTSPNTSLTTTDNPFDQYACNKNDGRCIQCCYQEAIDNGNCPMPDPIVCPNLGENSQYCMISGNLQVCQINCPCP